MLFRINVKQRYILAVMVPLIVIFLTISIVKYYFSIETQYRYFYSLAVFLLIIITIYELFLFNIGINDCIVKGIEALEYLKYDYAVNVFGMAIQRREALPLAYIGLGIAFLKKKQFSKALLNFNMVYDENTNFYDLYYYRGLLRISQYQSLNKEIKRKDFDYRVQEILTLAISDFNKAINIYSFKVNPIFLRGLSYYYYGNFSAALADFTKAIELNPNILESYIYRGFASCKIGELDTAWKDFQHARNAGIDGIQKLWEFLADAYFDRGLNYYREGELSKSWHDLHKAKDLGDGRAAALITKIEHYESLTKLSEDFSHPQKLAAMEGLDKLAKELEAHRGRIFPEADEDMMMGTVDYIKSQISATRDTLEAFIKTIEAQQDKKILDPEEKALIAKARLILSRLS